MCWIIQPTCVMLYNIQASFVLDLEPHTLEKRFIMSHNNYYIKYTWCNATSADFNDVTCIVSNLGYLVCSHDSLFTHALMLYVCKALT